MIINYMIIFHMYTIFVSYDVSFIAFAHMIIKNKLYFN